jgi:hypothetical protein
MLRLHEEVGEIQRPQAQDAVAACGGDEGRVNG